MSYSTEIAHDLSDHYADLYHVSRAAMWNVVMCEDGSLDPTMQSQRYYQKDIETWHVKQGDQELSYGLAMIHLPSWPDISVDQATDPDFSLDFLAQKLSQGKGSLWTCYRIQHKNPA